MSDIQALWSKFREDGEGCGKRRGLEYNQRPVNNPLRDRNEKGGSQAICRKGGQSDVRSIDLGIKMERHTGKREQRRESRC